MDALQHYIIRIGGFLGGNLIYKPLGLEQYKSFVEIKRDKKV